MGSSAVLQVQYAQCSLSATVPSAPSLSYVYVIQASPILTRDSGRDPSLHVVESSKSPTDDHLEDYYEEDEEDDNNEFEFVVKYVNHDAMISVT